VLLLGWTAKRTLLKGRSLYEKESRFLANHKHEVELSAMRQEEELDGQTESLLSSSHQHDDIIEEEEGCVGVNGNNNKMKVDGERFEGKVDLRKILDEEKVTPSSHIKSSQFNFIS